MLCLELGAASSSPGRGQVPTAGCHSLSPSVGLPFLLKFLSFFSTLTEDTSFSFFLDDCCIIKDDDQALRAKVLPRRRIKPGSWLAKERKGWMVITADTRGAHLDPIFLYNKRRCIPWWWPSSLVFVPAMLVFLVSLSVGKTSMPTRSRDSQSTMARLIDRNDSLIFLLAAALGVPWQSNAKAASFAQGSELPQSPPPSGADRLSLVRR